MDESEEEEEVEAEEEGAPARQVLGHRMQVHNTCIQRRAGWDNWQPCCTCRLPETCAGGWAYLVLCVIYCGRQV